MSGHHYGDQTGKNDYSAKSMHYSSMY